MENVFENIVALVKQHPAGIPVKRLGLYYQQTYRCNLARADLGFKSNAALLAALKDDLVVEKQLVFHKDYRCNNGAAGTSAIEATELKKERKKVKRAENVVAMMREYPEGLLLENLSTDYRLKYNTKLKWKSLGFTSVAALVATLDNDLVVIGDRVIHKMYQTQDPLEAAGTPFNSESAQSIPDKSPPTGSKLTDESERQHLHKKIVEVADKYQLTKPSMDLLEVCYFHHFGEKLPVQLYLSMYETLESSSLKNLPLPPGTGSAGLQQAAGVSTSKASDATRGEFSAPVFRKAFHAQLREVHQDNMRAIEAMENDEGTKNTNLHPDTLSSLMESVRRELAAEGELVTKEKVMARTCTLMQLKSKKINPQNIQALKDLHYLEKEISAYIQAAEAAATVCTLYELGQALAALKNKKRYEELNLGPLCKLPIIHRMFKMNSNTKDDDIPQIETVDILKHLRSYRRKSSQPKVDLAEFMKYLGDHYNCESPYELGIRITSLGLSISSLNKVSRCEHSVMDQIKETIQKELEEDTREHLMKLKKVVLDPVKGTCSIFAENLDLRKKYASMTAAEVVLEVFTNAEKLFSSPVLKANVRKFLTQVSGDRLATSLFQLAICGASLAIPQDQQAKKETPQSSGRKDPTEDRRATSKPSEAKVKQYLKDSLSSMNSAIHLADIATLEKNLSKHFQVKDFPSLGQGSFLGFLVKHIQLLQDVLGSTLILRSDGNGKRSFFRPTKQDIFEFIKQCGQNTSGGQDELSHMELALQSHYGVQDSRDLGYGSLQTLVRLVQRQRDLAGGGLSQVFYESTMFARHGILSAKSECEAVGRLGEMSKVQALASLHSCPLLEDLNEWSQWELIFKPFHGSLKDFIERNAENTELAALEVTPCLLLRITSDTGDKYFSNAAMTLDPVGTAGHLVSIVVADGILNAPMALLANHIQSSLAAAVAKEDLSRAEEDMSCYSTVANFLLECLVRIPNRICQAVLQQVFLEPLSKVLGQTKSKLVLITAAHSNPRHINCLHRLGILLGITEWLKDYQKKLTSAKPYGAFYTGPFHQPKIQTQWNVVDSERTRLSGVMNVSENGSLEDNATDSSLSSRHLNPSLQKGHGAKGGDEPVEEVLSEEELFASLSDDEMSNKSSEVQGPIVSQPEILDLNKEEKATCQSEPALDVHRNIIEEIRKKGFGIGVELSAEGQNLMQVQQDRLGRSLDRLSTELYSKDTHFVLELIQNADDNSYPSEPDAIPALAFVIEKDCITVLNNETGFQEANIKAICDVGQSTKGKHKYGYIGQKGIGFKSVFKVTDRPEIHSNGFHLFFDKTCGPIGYILPHWIDDERPLEPQLNEPFPPHSWTTKIRLPLRSECHQTRNLFHDVHPSLLLFLHRLRSITIYNQAESRIVTMTRKDLNHNVLEVEHSDGTERWLVVKSTLQPKMLKENVETTELALAFQLDCDNSESDMIGQPPKQPVFAYLPLRSFGFRFIIQGDFDIPSSREDVDRDSSWNQWLRSEIPQLFLQAMKVFNDHPDFTGLGGLCQSLQFIPLPDEVMDFFKPVANQIIQLLKGKAFLPTLSSDGQVVYKLPSQIAVCKDAVIRKVINQDELEKHLLLSYLHPSLKPAPPASLLSHLGVRNLRGSDVTTVTTAMAKELMKEETIHTDAGLRQLARLLVCNYRAVEHGYGDGDIILQTLRTLPIFPLADGRVVALDGDSVFFPVEESKTKKTKAQTAYLSELYKDVNIVHPSLMNCVEALESQQVQELLRRLGVHQLEPQELLEQHIYPVLQNEKWKSKPEAVIVTYLIFIKQHCISSQEYADIAIPVLTNKGLLCPAQSRVHFSEAYDNMDLSKTLPGYDWVLLSPKYLQADNDLAGWRQLFTRLGVGDGLIIRKEKQTLTSKELSSSPWSVESAMWHQTPGEDCVIDDYPCEEFHALATAQLTAPCLLEQRKALLNLLATNWNTGHRYSQYLTAQVIDSDARPIRTTNSSFYHYLCRLQWMPAFRPQEGEQSELAYLCPNAVYLNAPEIIDLLGTHVYYVNMKSSEFSRALGIRQNVSADELITYLKGWCIKGAADKQASLDHVPEGANFTSTIQHIRSIYSYLHTNCPQSTLQELFQHNPAVFIQVEYRSSGWCSGCFYHLREVCWSDPTHMFQRYSSLMRAGRRESLIEEPNVLAPFYSKLEGMKDFFIRLLNVDGSPNMRQYVALLEVIASSSPIPTAEVLQDVSVLYATLAGKCRIQVAGEHEDRPQYKRDLSYASTLKGMVSDKRVFPTKDMNWVSLARKPMIADSKELEKIFKSRKEVCLLNLPPAEKKTSQRNNTAFAGRTAPGEPAIPTFNENDRLIFMNICGIRLLSQCVKMESLTESWRPCAPMQSMVRSLIPHVQKFLYHHEDLACVYSELIQDNIAEKIKLLKFAQVGKLYLRYQLDLDDHEDAVVEMTDVICLLKDKKELYIQKDHLTAQLDICRELVKLFCTDSGHRKELMNFLSGLIASVSDPAALKRFLIKEDIRELPSEEEQWEVPEPPRPEVALEKAISRCPTLPSAPPRPEQEGEVTLISWPPRASIVNTGNHHSARADEAAVEAVLKMWPPPAPPKDSDPEKDVSAKASNHVVPPQKCDNSNHEGDKAFRTTSSKPAEQAGPERTTSQPNTSATDAAAAASKTQPPGRHQPSETSTSGHTQNGEETSEKNLTDPEPSAPSAQPIEAAGEQSAPDSLVVPEAVVLPSVFKDSQEKSQRPPLNLIFPTWDKRQAPHVTLEDLDVTCQRPSTVVISDERDLKAIGEWGELLVHSFLCHWRDSADPGRPTRVVWCNQSGESGQPYDFELTFGPAGQEDDSVASDVLYVEVKSTRKKEKSFIVLSANELQFALTKKERYHIFRVYNAGDAQNVRLCRIPNLAQHLHTKKLELFLFV